MEISKKHLERVGSVKESHTGSENSSTLVWSSMFVMDKVRKRRRPCSLHDGDLSSLQGAQRLSLFGYEIQKIDFSEA